MKTVVSIVIAVVVIGGAFLVFTQSSSTSPAHNTDASGNVSSAQDILPNVELQDSNGNDVDIHSVVLGTPAVINSWATWCPFCVDELPDFARLQEEHSNTLQVVAVNRAESQARAEGYLLDLEVLQGMTYLYDGGDNWYRAIGGFSMPETIFVDAEGNVVFHKRGPLTFEEADKIVREQLLSN